MRYRLIELPSIEVTSVEGSDRQAPFRTKRIICIARNYAAHAKEMRHALSDDAPPFFFFKPLSALNTGPHFTLPGFSNDCQHELELVVYLARGGRNLAPDQARACVGGFGLGLDMTARDLQHEAKRLGRPWDLAKGFDGSACISKLVKAGHDELPRFGRMRLRNNDREVQSGHWQEMIWPIDRLLAHISTLIALQPGDLVYTGTPAGVTKLTDGDRLTAEMEGFPHRLTVEVRAS